MGVKSLFSNVAYNFLVVSELWRFGCKAESKLQRLRAIHNGILKRTYERSAVKPNQNYKD